MKVLLIDDHPLILSALQSVIQGLGDDVTVVGVASARAARETLQANADFDLVLLDLHLGDADGFDVLAEFRSKYPALPVVVVSASDRTSDVIRSIDLGAMGFVPKRAQATKSLFEALRMVMSGGHLRAADDDGLGNARHEPKAARRRHRARACCAWSARTGRRRHPSRPRRRWPRSA